MTFCNKQNYKTAKGNLTALRNLKFLSEVSFGCFVKKDLKYNNPKRIIDGQRLKKSEQIMHVSLKIVSGLIFKLRLVESCWD